MTDTGIEALLAGRSAAIWEKDLERLLSFYSADVVYFDLVPPLHYVGIEALRGRFRHWFGGFTGTIGQDIHDLVVTTSDDLAIASMLIRAGGQRADGAEVSFFVRATSSFQHANERWLINHEHVSLPVDLAAGRAVLLGSPS